MTREYLISLSIYSIPLLVGVLAQSFVITMMTYIAFLVVLVLYFMLEKH